MAKNRKIASRKMMRSLHQMQGQIPPERLN